MVRIRRQSRPCRPLLLALALALFLGASCSGSPEPEVEKVVLIGVDGLDWRVLEPLIREGRVPNLARLVENGVSGELTTLLPTYSPLLWASVASGKLPAKHGITGFTQPPSIPGGTPVPFTSNSRRSESLWTVLGKLGHEVAVVGWWTTWPAEPVRGVLVSDRMLYNRFNLWFGLEHAGQDLPAQTHPPQLFDELAELARIPEDLEQEFFERFLPGEPRPVMQRNLHDPWYELFLVYARDRAYAKMLDRLLGDGSFDFVAYYLNGPDIASHYFWKYSFPEEWPDPIPAEEVKRYGEVIPRYYAYVDELLGSLLQQAGERCVVIVVSDHGFVTGRRGDSPNISGTHYRAGPPGVIVMAGGGLPAGAKIGEASILDVTPTLLHLLGHPVGRDMDGRVLPVATGRRGPVRFVESYEDGSRAAGGESIASTYDEAIVEKLRALGYLD